jgi:hypothetical protein
MSGFNPNDPRSFTLDCRPFPQKLSPFLWFAERIKNSTYPDAATAQRMTEARRFLLGLGARLPHVTTSDPILATMAARLALSGTERGELARLLADLETNIAAMYAEANAAAGSNGNGHAPAPPAGGFRVAD